MSWRFWRKTTSSNETHRPCRRRFDYGFVCQMSKTIPPNSADPKHPDDLPFGRAIVPRRWSRDDGRDIGHSRAMRNAPFHRSARADFCQKPGLYLGTNTISQCEERLPGEAGATEEHAHLWKRKPRPIQGDPGGVANDREAAVSIASAAMLRQPV